MKKFSILFFFIASLFVANAQNGCDGKRYLLDVFPDTTMTTVKYGANKNLVNQDIELFMTVVEPKGDVLTKRPLIVFAFGGGFVGGKKADMLSFCHAFAKKGFVTATIDYRLYSLALGFPTDSLKITPAIVQAAQDMKAAVRYFYKDAKTTNTFKVDTNMIIAGGLSAGAITAMIVGQYDDVNPSDKWIKDIMTAQGGIEGTSGNQGYSSKVHGVINMSGALYQKEWLDKGDVPFISYHGTIDKTVAYGYGKNVYNFYGHGSGSLYPEAKKLGIPAVLVSVPGGDHGDVYDPNGKWKTNLLDFNTRLVLFTKALACNEPVVSFATAANDIDLRQVKIYPNPSSDDMTLELGDNAQNGYTLSVFDLTGREILNSGNQFDYQYTLKKANIGTGMFITRVIFKEKQSVLVKKVIFE